MSKKEWWSPHSVLKELMLVVKQGFKLLDAFSFGCHHMTMLPIRQSHKINRAVISLDSVKVVNNPAIRQSLLISLLPNNNMLLNMATRPSSRMSWHIYAHITFIVYASATLPERRVLTPILSKLSTLLWIFPTMNSRAFPASSCPNTTKLTTIKAWVPMAFIPLIHTIIIANNLYNVNRLQGYYEG